MKRQHADLNQTRRINRSREESNKEREAEAQDTGLGDGNYQDYDENDEMQL